MKKRLRKKKHLGEFKELGFEVRGDLRPGLSGNDLEAFVDRLIDIVDARSLAFGGGAGRDDELNGFAGRARQCHGGRPRGAGRLPRSDCGDRPSRGGRAPRRLLGVQL